MILILGIGDWGFEIVDWGLGPIPNPQSPIPNPQYPYKCYNNKLNFKLNKKFNNSSSIHYFKKIIISS